MNTLLGKIKGKTSYLLKPVERRLFYAMGFNNAAGLKKNALYELYHWFCRYNYRRLNGRLPSAVNGSAQAVEGFRQNATGIFPATSESIRLLDAIPKSLLSKLDDPANVEPKFGFLSRHVFNREEFESVKPLLTPDIDTALKQLLKSYYLVANAYMYRTVASKATPTSTFLWHFDDHAECHLKVFYYLTDTKKTNGAIQVHSWSSARDLKRRGFLDRRNVPPKIARDLNDPKRYTVVEGPRGTAFIFCENTIHRAVIPEEKHRDVITFEILPSPNPNLQFTAFGKLGYWQNPLDILFPQPGREVSGTDYN